MIALLLALVASAADLPAGAPAPEAAAALAAGPDRSGPPPVVRSPRLPLEEAEVHALGPGVTARFVHVDGVRRVQVAALLGRGMYELDGGPTERAHAVGELLNLATSGYDAAALAEVSAVNELGHWSQIGMHNGTVGVTVPREKLALGLEVLGEIVRSPTYPKKDVARHLRNRRVFFELNGPASPAAVAQAAMAYSWYPADHPYGARPDLSAMKKLKGADLLALHQEWLSTSPIDVVVVGDVAWSEVEPGLKAVFGALGAAGARAPSLEVPPRTGRRVVAVDMPGQAQSTVALRMEAPSRSHEDRVAFGLADYALGGHFMSRLNANLREDKGYTYGTGSKYSPGEHAGSLSVSVDLRAEDTGAAIREIQAELARLAAEGITQEEVEWAVRGELFEWNETRKDASSAGAFYGERVVVGETVAAVAQRGEAAGGATLEQVKAVAGRWLGADAPQVWVVVGDRASLAPQLEALGWEVQWTDPSSAVLGSF